MNKFYEFLAEEKRTKEEIRRQFERIELIDGVAELLGKLSAKKISMSIISDGYDEVVRFVLQRERLFGSFDRIVCNSDRWIDDDRQLKIFPYSKERRFSCPNGCPFNLCKGPSLPSPFLLILCRSFFRRDRRSNSRGIETAANDFLRRRHERFVRLFALEGDRSALRPTRFSVGQNSSTDQRKAHRGKNFLLREFSANRRNSRGDERRLTFVVVVLSGKFQLDSIRRGVANKVAGRGKRRCFAAVGLAQDDLKPREFRVAIGPRREKTRCSTLFSFHRSVRLGSLARLTVRRRIGPTFFRAANLDVCFSPGWKSSKSFSGISSSSSFNRRENREFRSNFSDPSASPDG